MFNPLETLEPRELFSAVPGIYSEGRLLEGDRYAVQADANLLPAVRNALDEGVEDLTVVLDPGSSYRLKPLDGSDGPIINDLYLAGDRLRFVADPAADADGSGGRASLLLEKNDAGERKYPFYIAPRQGGELELEGVDLSAADRTDGEFIRFVVNHGNGGVSLDNASIEPGRVALPDRPAPAPPVPEAPFTPDPVDPPVGDDGIDLRPGSTAGIYENGMLLDDPRFAIRSGQDVLVPIRMAMNEGHRDILVALDPGERYELEAREGGRDHVHDLYLADANLQIAAIEEVDADGSGGRADLVLQRNNAGGYFNPFFLDARNSGDLTLESVDLTAEGRRSGEFIGFITHYGGGLVRLVDASVEEPTRRFEDATRNPRPTPTPAPTPDPVPDARPRVEPTPDRTPDRTPAPSTPGTGIFLNGEKLDGYDLRPGSNILPVIREAMDRVSTDLDIRLDPGETYGFSPEGDGNSFRVAHLSLAGSDLTFTASASADADGSGGYATLEVGPTAGDRWSNVFYMANSGTGSLLLDGISMTMPDRQPDDYVHFVVWRGGGDVTLLDSKFTGAHNNLDISGVGGPNARGADIVIRETIISHSNAPDRDIEYAPGRTGNPANGLYTRNYNTLLVEDSVFFHNGWRDDAILNTHASAYSHGIYANSGERTSFDPQNTRIINTIFSDSGANAAQLRQGGIVEDSFFFNNPFGVQLPAGSVSDSAFASGTAVWPRNGTDTNTYQRWNDRGGHAIQVNQGRDIETKRLGPVDLSGNVFADAIDVFPQRGPVYHSIDASRPQTVTASDNIELNWVDWRAGGPGSNLDVGGIDRGNQGSTALDGAFGSRFDTVDEIIEAAVSRDRADYGVDGVPEAVDLVGFYRDRAEAAAR